MDNSDWIISPRDFEIAVKQWLDDIWASHPNITIKHDETLATPDGDYQIDVYAECELAGIQVKFLIECKKQSRPVERDIVLSLNSKLQELGSHKGMIVATSGFQSGAKQYADKHGIALCVLGREKHSILSKAHTEDEATEEEFHPIYYAVGEELILSADPDAFEKVFGLKHGSRLLS
jgi:restriction system protein